MNVDEKIFTYCKYIKKACKVRNETIVKLLETLGGILENRHTGISTMNKKMKGANLPEPIFSNEREDFVVTFYNGEYPELYPEELKHNQIKNAQVNAQVNKSQITEEAIIEFCREPKSLKEITNYFGYKNVRGFREKYINQMLKSKKLRRTIPQKPTSSKQKYISK